jgi:hypothetical protein
MSRKSKISEEMLLSIESKNETIKQIAEKTALSYSAVYMKYKSWSTKKANVKSVE